MKTWLVFALFVIALININGCVEAKNEYTEYAAYQRGLGGFVEGFVDGYTGTTAFIQASQSRERQLATAKDHRFNWACGWTAVAVIAALSGKRKSPRPYI